MNKIAKKQLGYFLIKYPSCLYDSFNLFTLIKMQTQYRIVD